MVRRKRRLQTKRKIHVAKANLGQWASSWRNPMLNMIIFLIFFFSLQLGAIFFFTKKSAYLALCLQLLLASWLRGTSCLVVRPNPVVSSTCMRQIRHLECHQFTSAPCDITDGCRTVCFGTRFLQQQKKNQSRRRKRKDFLFLQRSLTCL